MASGSWAATGFSGSPGRSFSTALKEGQPFNDTAAPLRLRTTFDVVRGWLVFLPPRRVSVVGSRKAPIHLKTGVTFSSPFDDGRFLRSRMGYVAYGGASTVAGIFLVLGDTPDLCVARQTQIFALEALDWWLFATYPGCLRIETHACALMTKLPCPQSPEEPRVRSTLRGPSQIWQFS